MPLHQLSVAPADVSGAGLGLALNAPAPAPLAAVRLEHPDGGALVLGVLGASHSSPSSTPKVASPNRFPATSVASYPSAPRHRATALSPRTDVHDEPTFREIANDLRRHCERENGWLGGTFPGDDAALTALAAEPDGPGWRWQTWHLYPSARGGTIVYTASRWHP